ncbi:MAG: cupin [Pseudorhodobacter sp. PARRP1]|nr:MAG: cupin [Pseudorhodobacter sp. PARRP1]
MSQIERVTRAGIQPEITRPDPSRVLAGDPVHTTWNIEDRDGLYCGLWQSTPGTWTVSYSEWEYVYIHAGHSVLTDANGTQTTLKAGDSFIIRPGYSGSWQVIETTLKDYVIKA